MEYARGVTARTRVFAARTFAGILGGIALTGLLASVTADPAIALQTAGLFLMITAPFTAFALLSLVPDPSPAHAAVRPEQMLAVFTLCFGSQRRRRLALLFALCGAGSAVANGSLVYFVAHAMALPAAVTGIFFLQAASTAGGLFLGLGLQKRLGTWLTLQNVFAVNFLLSLALLFLPAGNLSLLIFWAVLRGIFSGIDFMLLRALAGTELDDEIEKTGCSRAGTIYASFHMPLNLANAVTAGLLFWGLAHAGFDPSATPGDQTTGAIRLLPAVLGMAVSGASLLVAAAENLRPKASQKTEHSYYSPP